MAVDREQVLGVLRGVSHPEGGDLVGRDLIRALSVEEGVVRFVIEAATPDEARALGAAQAEAEARLRALPVYTA